MNQKNKFGNNLLDAMEAVDENVIEKAGGKWTGKRKWSKYRVALTAASAVLVLGVGGVVGYRMTCDKRTNCRDVWTGEKNEQMQHKEGKNSSEEKVVKVGSDKLLETYKLQEAFMGDTCGTGHMDMESSSVKWVDEEEINDMIAFCQKTMPSVLSQKQGDNAAYSPINLYMAGSMLTEMADGETRQQLLNILGTEDMGTLQNQNNALWNAVYDFGDDVDFPCKLANSLWVRENLLCKKSTIQNLATSYHASSYRGPVGEQMDQAIQTWVNRETGGKLEKEAKGIQTQEDTACVLMSTLHLRDQWVTPFDENSTLQNMFHTQDGEEILTDFMNQTIHANVLEGEDYLAASLNMEGGRSMRIILPEEGVNMNEFIQENGADALVDVCGSKMDEVGQSELVLSLPKFSFHSTLDMVPILQELGVQDAFNYSADFSNLQTDETDGTQEAKIKSIFVDKVSQSSVISVDETGCSVDSFTEVQMLYKGGGIADKRYIMNCNRPFLFVITSGEGIPIFMGVVNYPAH